jgi:hypothetical protein
MQTRLLIQKKIHILSTVLDRGIAPQWFTVKEFDAAICNSHPAV